MLNSKETRIDPYDILQVNFHQSLKLEPIVLRF